MVDYDIPYAHGLDLWVGIIPVWKRIFSSRAKIAELESYLKELSLYVNLFT
jgi:hypothetical protein